MLQAVDFAPLQTAIPHQEIPDNGVCRDAFGSRLLDKHHCQNVLPVLTTGLLMGQKHQRWHLLE